MPTALGGVGSLAIAVVQLVQGVQHLSLVVPNVVAGIAALQTAGAQFAQGVNHTMLAAQLGAPGIAVLPDRRWPFCSRHWPPDDGWQCRCHGADLLAGRSSFIPEPLRYAEMLHPENRSD